MSYKRAPLLLISPLPTAFTQVATMTMEGGVTHWGGGGITNSQFTHQPTNPAKVRVGGNIKGLPQLGGKDQQGINVDKIGAKG